RDYLGGKVLSAFDSAALLERHPFSGRAMLRWSDSARGNSFRLSPLALGSFSESGGGDTLGKVMLSGVGARIYGSLGGALTYYTHATVFTEKTDSARFTHQFDPEFGETYSVEK